MEYIASGVLALLLGMKFTDFTSKKQKKEFEEAQQELVVRIEEMDSKLTATEIETLKKVLRTIQPVAVAVQRLNTEVGIQ